MMARHGLLLGSVVLHAPERGGRGPERGIVIWSDGRGIQGHQRVMASDRYIIQRQPGIYTQGNDVSAWTPIDTAEWTVEERLMSAMLRWRPPEWDDPAEHDSFEFALLRALLPPHIYEDLDEGCHPPTTNYELALEVARWLDHALPAQRTLGSALARLGGSHG